MSCWFSWVYNTRAVVPYIFPILGKGPCHRLIQESRSHSWFFLNLEPISNLKQTLSILFPGDLVVKDLALLWLRFDPWPGSFCMPRVQSKNNTAFSGLSLCFLSTLGRGRWCCRKPGAQAWLSSMRWWPCSLSLSRSPRNPRRPPCFFQKGFLSNLEEKDKINTGLYLALFCKPWDATSSLT